MPKISNVFPYDVYIPTYDRKEIKTWDNLPESIRDKVILVVHPNEYSQIRRKYPDARLLRCTQQGKSCTTVRQWILDEVCRNEDVCITLDDDLVFQYAHMEDGKKRFRKATPKQIEQAFFKTAEMAIKPNVGFSAFGTPFFNNTTNTWIKNRKGCYAWFINMEAIRKSGASFSGVPTAGDLHLCLGLAEAGYESYLNSMLVVVDQSTRGVGGESSVFDRAGRFEKAVRILCEKWPDFVKVRKVERNARHLANIGCRFDITVYFARAVKSGQAKRSRVSLGGG